MPAINDPVAAQMLRYTKTVVGTKKLAAAWSVLYFGPNGAKAFTTGYFVCCHKTGE